MVWFNVGLLSPTLVDEDTHSSQSTCLGWLTPSKGPHQSFVPGTFTAVQPLRGRSGTKNRSQTATRRERVSLLTVVDANYVPQLGAI